MRTLRSGRQRGWRYRAWILGAQVGVVVGFLAAWQFLPKIDFLQRRWHVLDPFFISSPERVAEQLWDMFGGGGVISAWGYVGATVWASVIGTAIGLVSGAVLGLLFSNSEALTKVLWPFVIAINAIPRIALIPIVVIMFGPSTTSSVVTAVMVVFFVAFFNAYEGGRSLPPHMVQNAWLHGASRLQIMWHVRSKYVLAWTLAALPNAVSFGLVSVVTAEILTGRVGLGRLLIVSVSTVDSTLTFAVVVVLSAVGILLVGASERMKQRWLHWWAQG